jgi:hypothetical protein
VQYISWLLQFLLLLATVGRSSVSWSHRRCGLAHCRSG